MCKSHSKLGPTPIADDMNTALNVPDASPVTGKRGDVRSVSSTTASRDVGGAGDSGEAEEKGVLGIRSQSPGDLQLSAQLFTACRKGLGELVQLFLIRGADVEYMSESGLTPLMAACSNGHLTVVKELVAYSANVIAEAIDGFTALMEACTSGHAGIVNYLLWARAPVSHASKDGTTPLMLASLHNHLEVVVLLLGDNADALQAKPDGSTALRAACSNGHDRVLALFLSHNGECLHMEGPALLDAACAGGHAGVVEVLLDKGVPPSVSALLQACMTSRRDVASLLISRGVHIHDALVAARQNGNLSAVQRALRGIRPPVRQDSEESVNLDELAREIEGRPSSTRTAPGRSRTAANMVYHKPNKGRGKGIFLSRKVRTIPAVTSACSTSSDTDSSSESEVSISCENGSSKQVVPSPSTSPGTAVGSIPQDTVTNSCTTEFAIDEWAMQRLSLAGQPARTFYSVEVLGEEEYKCTNDAGIFQTCRDDDKWGGNLAIRAARCRGWLVKDLVLLPLNAGEEVDIARLTAGGVEVCSADHVVRGSSPAPSSSSSSLPDRDARVEFEEWCASSLHAYRESNAGKRTMMT